MASIAWLIACFMLFPDHPRHVRVRVRCRPACRVRGLGPLSVVSARRGPRAGVQGARARGGVPGEAARQVQGGDGGRRPQDHGRDDQEDRERHDHAHRPCGGRAVWRRRPRGEDVAPRRWGLQPRHRDSNQPLGPPNSSAATPTIPPRCNSNHAATPTTPQLQPRRASPTSAAVPLPERACRIAVAWPQGGQGDPGGAARTR
eukprot:7388033-Prymnesium_polylepis.1